MDSYEKKYKEALERAKEIKSKILSSHLSTESCKAVSEYIDTIIPELAESEDERIRKEIVSIVQSYRDSCISEGAHRFDDCLAWLEKQKEQKPDKNYWNPTEMDAALFNKAVTTNTSLTPSERAQLDIIRSKFRHCYGITQEQKPAEWSEEDEKKLRLAINSCEMCGNPFTASWLKSLRPQPKKELSIEKAIQWLDDTFYFLDNSSGRGRDYEITTHDFDSLEEMYNSFRKAVTVDSEPHWKPSEELPKWRRMPPGYEIRPANVCTIAVDTLDVNGKCIGQIGRTILQNGYEYLFLDELEKLPREGMK